jgi:hypothetical protein
MPSYRFRWMGSGLGWSGPLMLYRERRPFRLPVGPVR